MKQRLLFFCARDKGYETALPTDPTSCNVTTKCDDEDRPHN
jgi:hypothetical protein